MSNAIEVIAVQSVLAVSFKGVTVEMSTREAFDLVTDFLREIDKARGFGEAMRKEVRNPRPTPTRTRRPTPKPKRMVNRQVVDTCPCGSTDLTHSDGCDGL